jgi:hypothetical protein
MTSPFVVSGSLEQLKTHGVLCLSLLHTHEVTGSSPVGPINRMNALGGSKWPAFFLCPQKITERLETLIDAQIDNATGIRQPDFGSSRIAIVSSESDWISRSGPYHSPKTCRLLLPKYRTSAGSSSAYCDVACVAIHNMNREEFERQIVVPIVTGLLLIVLFVAAAILTE